VNEFELIRQLTQSLPGNETVVTGPGDDCAVLDLGIPGQLLLFKTDAVVESIHFTRESAPEKIGHKALARCLSDIAAMAGTPTAVLITLALPREFDPAFISSIYDGMNVLARRYNVAIVGGETTTNPERILISIALLGTVPRDKCVHRSGSKPGDVLFVSGELGGSIAGRHLEFEPRLVEARWLAENFKLHAMIDISDGLAGDLRHLLEPSHAGADLLKTAIPISRAARLQARSKGQPPLLAALTDGEDFELLFTVAPRDAVPLADAWRARFPDIKISCIGKISATPGLRLSDKNGMQTFTGDGYVHFS